MWQVEEASCGTDGLRSNLACLASRASPLEGRVYAYAQLAHYMLAGSSGAPGHIV